MRYKIIYASTAQKELNNLPKRDFIQLQRAIDSLSDNHFHRVI